MESAMTLTAVQWDMSSPGKQTPWKGASGRKIYRLGYIWFLYGGYPGELLYVRFSKQIFFPINNTVDGYGCSFEPGVNGIVTPLGWQLNTSPLQILGKVINFELGNLGGLTSIGADGFQGPAPVLAQISQNQRLIAPR